MTATTRRNVAKSREACTRPRRRAQPNPNPERSDADAQSVCPEDPPITPAGARPGAFSEGTPTALPASVPAAIRERLKGAGVSSCQDWIGLGCKRFLIFSVTRCHVDLVDRACAAVGA